jgi:hypothetical protein
LARLDSEIHVHQGAHAAEADRHLSCLENRRHGVAAADMPGPPSR